MSPLGWQLLAIVVATGLVLGLAWVLLHKLEDLRQAHDEDRYTRR